MMVNKYFECTVRIQSERNHQVCSDVPYKYVRHPGYSSIILTGPSYPLILGSWWAYVAIAALILLIVVRTILEDNTLKKELPGYREFVQKTRYGLIPLAP